MGELKMIYSELSAVMAEVGAIGKDSYNSFQKYKFRGIDDVMNALYPVLVKHQILIEPQMLDKQIEIVPTKDGKTQIHALLTMQYRFYAPDGSYVTAVTLGEGLDTSDKACNKAMAVAMKYAMFQTFCIPTEEMRQSDPDNYNPQYSAPTVSLNDRVEAAANLTMCEDCKQPITPVSVSIGGGKVDLSVESIVAKSTAKYSACLCYDCSVKRSAKKV